MTKIIVVKMVRCLGTGKNNSEALSENGGSHDIGLNNWKKEKGGVDFKEHD